MQKKKNRTKQNITPCETIKTTYNKKNKPRCKKNKPCNNNKTNYNFFLQEKTEQKTKPHHSFERKPLFWKNKKNFLLKDN